MDVKEVGFNYVYGILLAQNRDMCRAVVNTVMNIRFLKDGEFHDTLSDCQVFNKDSALWSQFNTSEMFFSVRWMRNGRKLGIWKDIDLQIILKILIYIIILYPSSVPTFISQSCRTS
jgi:hypothetical protein